MSVRFDNEPEPTRQRTIVLRLLFPFGNRHFSNWQNPPNYLIKHHHQVTNHSAKPPTCIDISNSRCFSNCHIYKGYSSHSKFHQSLQRGLRPKNTIFVANSTTLSPKPPCVQNEITPYEIFDFRVVALFLVKHLVNMLNPDCPKNNALVEVPNLHSIDKLLKNPLYEEGMFPNG